MKALKITILAIISFSVFIAYSYCDIGPHDWKFSGKLNEMISNIDEFPGISFIAYFYRLNPKTYIIKQNQRFNRYLNVKEIGTIYAVKTSYIKGKDLNAIDFPSDPNCVKLYEELHSIRLTSSYYFELRDSSKLGGCKEINFIYTILGFRKGKLIIYKQKETYKFGFFTPNKTITFEKPDTTGIVTNID